MISGNSRRQFMKTTGGVGLALLASQLPLLRPQLARAEPATQADVVSRVADFASKAAIANNIWADRGKAPIGYIKGMAISFARVDYALTTGDPDAAEMAKAMTPDVSRDALKHYAAIFQKAGMDNTKDGPETLRHLFVLLLGLGMRESSGRYCEGRDQSTDNTTAETAEAGLFQTSFNARHAHPLLPKLFEQCRKNPTPSYLDLFREGVRPKDAELEGFGTGDGRDFQRLSKECPFFAVQFAAIGLRNVRKHWGPINRCAAEVKIEADTMFKDVKSFVEQHHLGPLL